jgi:hypothetical protein
MGYTHGKEWNEENTKEAIMEIVNSLKLKHFPSKSQIIAFCGNNALANRISRSGGSKYYADLLGLEILYCESEFGNFFEELAIDEILLPALQIHRRMPIYRIACDITEEAGWRAMQQLLERSPKLPLGIFAAGDFAAKGAIKYALASGLKLKKDLLITGCTGLAESGAWHPPLSVLTTPFQRIGSLTAELITQLSKGQKLPEYITVDSRLIIRGS